MSTSPDWKWNLKKTNAEVNQILHVQGINFDNQEGPRHRAIEEACRKMDSCIDIVLEVLYNFSDFYLENNDLQKSKKIVCEMEKKS